KTTEFENFSSRLARRLGNDRRLMQTIVEAFAGPEGVLDKHKVKIKRVFAQEDLMAEVEGRIAAAGYKTELIPDLEHGLSEIEITLTNAQKVVLDWNLASYVEFQKSVDLFGDLEEDFAGPFILGENGTSEAIDD